jgi:Sulfotransferase domain
MPLGVIGAGFGRTGTTSLKAALEELGFDPCHEDLFGHPERLNDRLIWEDTFGGNFEG